jgi:GntR family transcriptional regulator, transcriptional repressor for pyruvate dehydrogenase complex
VPPAKLTGLKSVRLSDQAANQIQTLIMEGHWQPGQRLPSESELVKILRVSRSSVREAFRNLETRGVIQVRTGAGAFVSDRPFSFHASSEAIEWLLQRQESLVHILQVREVLEGLAASLLATRVTDVTLRELREIVHRQHQIVASTQDIDTLSELDIQFHQLIARASGNELSEEMISSIVSRFCTGNRAVLYVSGTAEMSCEEHEQIIQALATRDSSAAENAIRKHIARVRDEIMRIPAEGMSKQNSL